MKPQTLAIVLLSLVVTSLVAWLSWPVDHDAAPPAPAATQETATHAAVGAGPEVASGTGAGTEAAASTRVAADGAQRAAIVATGDTVGSRVAVRGRLVDRQGRPRTGIELELRSFRGSDDFESTLALPAGGGFAGNGRRDWPRQQTGDDGRFRFDLGSDHQGSLHLVSEQFVFAIGEVPVRGDQGDVDLGDLVAIRSAIVAGVVQDERGQPVADVKVGITSGALPIGFRNSTTTGADGRFRLVRLGPGRVLLRTASGRFLPATQELDLAAEEERLDVVLVLEQGHAIAGQVVDDRGMPVAGIKVGAKRSERRAGVEVERFTPDEAATTDARGWFTLAGLTGETAAVRTWGTGYTTAVEPNVAVGTGNLLLRVQRTGSIAGVLVDAQGQPIAGSEITAVRASGRGDGDAVEVALHEAAVRLPMLGDRSMAVTAADGSFMLASVPPGTLTVRATGVGHRPVERAGVVVAAAMAVKDLRLVADRGAGLRVKVRDDQGVPVANAKVRVAEQRQRDVAAEPRGARVSSRAISASRGNGGPVRVFGDDSELGSATTDAEGMAEIHGLPAGPVTVFASHKELAEAKPLDLVLATTAIDATLTMRRPAFAEITVRSASGAAVAGAGCRVHGPIGGDEEERDRSATTDANGTVRVGPLPAGEYWAELQLEPKPQRMGDAMMFVSGDRTSLPQTRRSFHLVAGQSAAIELQKPILSRVWGIVTGSAGPVADCVVELEAATGDAQIRVPGLPGQGVRTDSEGRFELTDVAAGRYVLVFGRPEQLAKARHELVVPENTEELRQDLSLRTGRLRLQVLAKATGAGIEGAEVELVVPSASGAPQRREARVMMISTISSTDGGGSESTSMTMGNQRSKAGADGIVEIDDVPAGRYTVRVSHPGHAAKDLPDQVVVEQRLTDAGQVELDAAGRIRGKVVAADGKQVPIAMVRCRKVGAPGGIDDGERQPAMGGNFRFDGLAPGRYVLQAQRLAMGPPGGAQPPFGPEVEVDVAAGGEPAVAELTVGG